MRAGIPPRLPRLVCRSRSSGAGGRIRTCVAVRRLIYSQLELATLPPLQGLLVLCPRLGNGAEATLWSPRGDSNPPTYRLQIGCAAIAPLGHESPPGARARTQNPASQREASRISIRSVFGEGQREGNAMAYLGWDCRPLDYDRCWHDKELTYHAWCISKLPWTSRSARWISTALPSGGRLRPRADRWTTGSRPRRRRRSLVSMAH